MLASERLKQWRGALSLNQAARRLGVDLGSLKKWEDGTARPGAKAMLRIERVVGISPRAWFSDEELSEIDSAA